ncbi:MAG: metalloregulator ArsR/SmtB family transcription factor [Actinomycetia bacterium]|nr:metalloregulator ArsR/SmtB family transcription factor [Actinomycetes bacterium]
MPRVGAREIYDLHVRVCKAIADPKRLLILDALRDGSRSVGEIAEDLGMSQPNTSQHLAILRERNIVTTSRSGNTTYYSLNSRKVIEAVDLLREFMAEFMSDDAADPGVVAAPAAAAP